MASQTSDWLIGASRHFASRSRPHTLRLRYCHLRGGHFAKESLARFSRPTLVCGSGIGACIACNKIPGIRAALIHDTYCAHQCVEHDNVNVACVGAWIIGVETAEEVLKAYLNATFGTDEDLRRRVQKLDQMDRKR
jgi:RpiB/LacA/LacB family sugar-phosphate isomerase